MGIQAHLIEYKNCNLGGGADFFDILEKHFQNEHEVYIDIVNWKSLMKAKPEIKEKFPEEVKAVELDLEQEDGCVSYVFF